MGEMGIWWVDLSYEEFFIIFIGGFYESLGIEDYRRWKILLREVGFRNLCLNFSLLD